MEAALKALGQAAGRRTAMRALKLAAQPIQTMWHRLVPVDDGDLKRAVKIGRAIKGIQKRIPKDTVQTFVGIDESEDRRLHIYAEVQEFGNESNPAQPAGRPAFDQQKLNAFERLAGDMLSEIEKTAKREARKTARLARKAAAGL